MGIQLLLNFRRDSDIFEPKEVSREPKSSVAPVIPSKQGVVDHSG